MRHLLACRPTGSPGRLAIGSRLTLVCFFYLVLSSWTTARCQEDPASNSPAHQPASSSAASDTSQIQAEVGHRDITYIRDFVLFRYDYKLQDGPDETNRFRLKLLYAFGPDSRFGASVSVPVMFETTPTASAFGSGDTEIVVGAILYRNPSFRTAITFQVTPQTSSENLLGGSTTTIKPAWGFSQVFSSRCQLTAAFYYEQSVHTVRGAPTKQFEPDLTFNFRVLRATWFVEYDSYYLFIPSQYAQTMKLGGSRTLGRDKQWVASAYYSVAINDPGTATQYHYNPGFDLTWYPFKNK